MPDNRRIRRPLDARRIAASQRYEQKYWLQKLDFGRGNSRFLMLIIELAGTNSVRGVKRWISDNRTLVRRLKIAYRLGFF